MNDPVRRLSDAELEEQARITPEDIARAKESAQRHGSGAVAGEQVLRAARGAEIADRGAQQAPGSGWTRLGSKLRPA